MPLPSKASRRTSLLYSSGENGFDTAGTAGWPSGFPCDPFLNILALLCLWVLVRKIRSSSFRVLYDAAVVAFMIGLKNKQSLYVAFKKLISNIRLDGGAHKNLNLGAISALIFVFLACCRYIKRFLYDSSNHVTTFQTSGLEPRIFPCRTTHTRLFPKSHSFSYSYLYAGVPIGWSGSVNALLSADASGSGLGSQNDSSDKSWFSVNSSDYLHRVSTETSLLQKLRQYLDSQGVAPQRYPYAYLVTAPRFLDTSFNPVSFWYLYSEQKQLKAMILEVNNTFDERRMYLMEGTHSHAKEDATGKDFFLHSWAKDFHVSPFNERDGNYALRASDPFAPNMSGEGYIDNTITLSALDGTPKLVARVFSVEPPILASRVSRLQALRFVGKWWWVGFMTNVRILREARKLWTKNLQVFYRPEVMKTSIGRRATAEEVVLAENFVKLLRYIQRYGQGSSPIRYTAAAGANRGRPITIAPADAPAGSASDSGSMIDLYILTPAFYSRFIEYSDLAEAFRNLCLCKAEHERLAGLSDPKMFLQQIASLMPANAQSLAPEFLWDCHLLEAARKSQLCRTLSLLLLAPFPTWSSSRLLQSSQPSLADLVALNSGSSLREDTQPYKDAVISVILAKRLALGSMSLLHLYKNMLRFILLWLVAGRVQAIVPILHTIFVT
jgi:DUF1365 family protein